MAFEEVCPDRIDLIHKNYRKLCNLLIDVEEWGQVVIIHMLTRYARTQFVSPWKEVSCFPFLFLKSYFKYLVFFFNTLKLYGNRKYMKVNYCCLLLLLNESNTLPTEKPLVPSTVLCFMIL